MTRFDRKLARIRAGDYTKKDFMIADAKDGDMGSGVNVGGEMQDSDGRFVRWKTRQEYLGQIKAVVAQDIVDIMLTSISNLEILHEQNVFANSAVKPVIRANDATDCWGGVRAQSYTRERCRPFRTAVLSRVMYGTMQSSANQRITGTDLGLYSITFNNDLDADMESLQAFADFRQEAANIGFKYFLEVFNPNAPRGLNPSDIPSFVNDCLIRSLSGVAKADRPQFLKIPFNGHKHLEELASFDPSLTIGVLGGGAGTTRDTFELLFQAERAGARLALFGRKINLAASPLALIQLMRNVVDGDVTPVEAVKAYHGQLKQQGIRSKLDIKDDMEITEAPLKNG